MLTAPETVLQFVPPSVETSNVLAADFKLGLHQYNQLASLLRRRLQHRREHECSRDKRHVDGNEIDRNPHILALQVTRVGALQ